MKRNLTLFVLSLCLTLVISCSKKSSDPTASTTGFSAAVIKVAPQSTIDAFRAKGMTINEGSVPPIINGIYKASPYTLLTSFGPTDSYTVGKVIGDYTFKFYNQSSDNSAVTFDYTNHNGDTGTGSGGVVAGNGSSFTVFATAIGTNSSGISYATTRAISGIITTTGIKNLQDGLILTAKGSDPSGTLIAVGQGRVWYDGDYMASTTTTFDLSAQKGPSQDGAIMLNK